VVFYREERDIKPPIFHFFLHEKTHLLKEKSVGERNEEGFGFKNWWESFIKVKNEPFLFSSYHHEGI
jgi:hypothetical protein